MSVSSFKKRLRSRLDAAAGEGSTGVALPELSDSQVAALEAYFNLLRHWNRRINLTALSLDGPPEGTLDRLFVEPLCAARFLGGLSTRAVYEFKTLLVEGQPAESVNSKPSEAVKREQTEAFDGGKIEAVDGKQKEAAGRTSSTLPSAMAAKQLRPGVELLRWADLGSGGGSPAIPLKIACPSTHLTMVESRGRKAAFLREAARELDLPDVTVESLRAEGLPADHSFGAITVRAVRLDADFLAAVQGLLEPQGRLILFLSGPAAGELEGFTRIDRSMIAATTSRIDLFSRTEVLPLRSRA